MQTCTDTDLIAGTLVAELRVIQLQNRQFDRVFSDRVRRLEEDLSATEADSHQISAQVRDIIARLYLASSS